MTASRPDDRWWCIAALLVVASMLAGQQVAAAPATPSTSPDELAGLWKAKRRFGPDARGPLVIERTGTTYMADMNGWSIPVQSGKGELTFELPTRQGTFRGKLTQNGEAILGHWFPHDSEGMSFQLASPVRLVRMAAGRWSGEVVPVEIAFTFFLLLEKSPEGSTTPGSLHAILRNPERDLGAQWGVERLTREGQVVKLLGRRSAQQEASEVAAGTYDADRAVLTLNFPSRGGSYDFHREGDESDFYPRGKNPPRYVYRPPLRRDDGWPTGTLAEAGIDRPAMERFIQSIVDTPIDSKDAPEVHGVLVARHGKLVLEEYFHGQHRDKLHDTRSAAKSLTATVIGAAMQAGAPLSLSTPVYQLMSGGSFPADLEARKRAMTLENLLTMSSGYFCDDTNPDAPGNEENMLDQEAEPDYYRYALKLPMAWSPGERSIYCSINPNLALGMLGRATGESPMDLFDRLVAAPLKIGRYGWLLDPAGQPYGGGSMQLLPRDFMKLGQLMLNDGTWEGRRILGHDFVARASAPLYHLRGVYYGYLWWGIDFPYKDRTVHAFYAGGAGGQGVVVIPALDLVIATYAGNYSSKGGIHIQQELIPQFILPAVREPGDDATAPVRFREWSTPYGKSPDGSPVSNAAH